MNKQDKIYIPGHRGLAGSAIYRNLEKEGFSNLLVRTHSQLDLTRQVAVEEFFQAEKPDYVFLAAAKVGGIQANSTYPVEFTYDNLMIQNNVIKAAADTQVKKLMFLGSSCIYPRICPQPMKEEYLLDGKLEPTNEGYAIAKIAGIRLCEYYKKQYGKNFISVMPCALYGEGDNFNPETAHVVPSLIRRFDEAKRNNIPEVVVWGTGNARRELMYVDDFASACVYFMEHYEETEFINFGSGIDFSIRELAEKLKKIVGYTGKLVFDASRPDGMPKKMMDVTRLHQYDWRPQIMPDQGLEMAYQWYLSHILKESSET